MSSRISNEDMDQRVEFARQGWTVPGAYLVQEYDDGRQLNRMLDETVAERNQLSAENEQLRAQLAAVPVDTIRRIVDAAIDRANKQLSQAPVDNVDGDVVIEDGEDDPGF